jgi:hypothetical protein
MLIQLFQPPKPPEVNESDVSVRHTLMETGPRYHATGRASHEPTVEEVLRRLQNKRVAAYRYRQRKKAGK